MTNRRHMYTNLVRTSSLELMDNYKEAYKAIEKALKSGKIKESRIDKSVLPRLCFYKPSHGTFRGAAFCVPLHHNFGRTP